LDKRLLGRAATGYASLRHFVLAAMAATFRIPHAVVLRQLFVDFEFVKEQKKLCACLVGLAALAPIALETSFLRERKTQTKIIRNQTFPSFGGVGVDKYFWDVYTENIIFENTCFQSGDKYVTRTNLALQRKQSHQTSPNRDRLSRTGMRFANIPNGGGYFYLIKN
jgi:hypothetical protein